MAKRPKAKRPKAKRVRAVLCPVPCTECAVMLEASALYIRRIIDGAIIGKTFSPSAYVHKCGCGWTYTTKYDKAGMHPAAKAGKDIPLTRPAKRKGKKHG